MVCYVSAVIFACLRHGTREGSSGRWGNAKTPVPCLAELTVLHPAFVPAQVRVLALHLIPLFDDMRANFQTRYLIRRKHSVSLVKLGFGDETVSS